MSPTDIKLTPRAALAELTEHPHYAYRGCAPDADDPRRAAGNPDLSVDAWTANTADGGELQKVRETREALAVDVCMGCAVWAVCRTYGNAVGADGRLVEPHGILGGETALERHRKLVKARQDALPAPAPDRFFQTEQIQDLLYALARHAATADIERVADMDQRTANWQRSRLTTKLGLPKTATRNEVLRAALERGLVEKQWVRFDDGSVPAIAPTPRAEEPEPWRLRTVGRRPARSKFSDIAGQLELDLAHIADARRATVHSLPARTTPVEAAA